MLDDLKNARSSLIASFDRLLASGRANEEVRRIFDLADLATAHCQRLAHCIGHPVGPSMVDFVDATYQAVWNCLAELTSCDRMTFALFHDGDSSTLDDLIAWLTSIVEQVRANSNYPTFAPTAELRNLYPSPWFTEAAIEGLMVAIFCDRLPATFGLKDCAAVIECDDTQTVRNYLMGAGIAVPSGRGKSRKYTLAELRRFVAHVLRHPTRESHKTAATHWLTNQQRFS